MPPNQESGQTFSQWTLSSWNKQLVRGIFRRAGRSGNFDPLTTLSVSRESLARLADVEGDADEVFQAYRDCIRRHLKFSGHSLDTDAESCWESSGWHVSRDSDPPFWGHLVFTSYVASSADIHITSKDFRNRLGPSGIVRLLRLVLGSSKCPS